MCESLDWRHGERPPAVGPGAIHLWRIPLAPLPQRRLDELRGWLSPDEQQRIDRLIIPTTAQRFLIARARLRDILARYLEVSPASLAFAYGPHGKPGLVTPPATLQFNLSHSGDLAVLAVAADQPLGVDLERVRPMRNLLAIAKRTFSPHEYRQLRQLPHERRLQAFFGAWTAMEAQAKARGCGIFANVADQAAPACELRHLAPAPAYLAAVAAEHLPPHPEGWYYLEP